MDFKTYCVKLFCQISGITTTQDGLNTNVISDEPQRKKARSKKSAPVITSGPVETKALLGDRVELKCGSDAGDAAKTEW